MSITIDRRTVTGLLVGAAMVAAAAAATLAVVVTVLTLPGRTALALHHGERVPSVPWPERNGSPVPAPQSR